MKTVAIVGAGPAGLVTAKTLLKARGGGAFRVTVFEKAPRLGGIWALDERSTSEGFLNAYTQTNLSQFQVCFSDLAWDNVDCTPSVSVSNGTANGHANGNGTAHAVKDPLRSPMFPKAWMANRYLETYAQRYIPRDAIQCGREVKSTARVKDTEGEGFKWHITTDGKDGQKTGIFDHLVVASGFFSKPRVPAKELDPFHGQAGKAPVKLIHTSQFRGLKDLFHDDVPAKNKKILIFGGGNSAGETGGTVAFAISSALHSSQEGADRYEGCKLLQVTPRPLYSLPPFLPPNKEAPGFVPIDCRFYDLAARPPDEIISVAGRQPAAVIKMMHENAQSCVGGKQADLGPEALRIAEKDEQRTSQVCLSDNFAEFVRSGDIDALTGRVMRIESVPEKQTVRALVDNNGQQTWVEDIGAVIHATGYTPFEALAYLPEEVKQTLEYDASAHRLPLILDEVQTLNAGVPDLAFVGFYEGPYWGMMQMQARLISQRWLGELRGIQRPSEAAEQMRSLRAGMAAREPDVPQYWLGDYLGQMEHFARDLRLQRIDAPFAGPRDGFLMPARFVDPAVDDVTEAQTAMTKLFNTVRAAEKGAFAARAVARAIQGRWSLHRTIASAHPDFPSGTFYGVASFHPRAPTAHGADGVPFDLEMLYVEQGAFVAESSGLSFQASRRYVYRYRERGDTLSVWFVKDDGYTVDYLFHDLAFGPMPSKAGAEPYVATADHLCVEDMYRTRYEFAFDGVRLKDVRLRHQVKGPKKDYVADSRFERPEKSAAST